MSSKTPQYFFRLKLHSWYVLFFNFLISCFVLETPPPEKYYKVAEQVMRFVVGHSVVKDEFKLIPFGQKEPVPGPDVCADIRERYKKYRDDIAPRHELKVEDNILNLW